MKSILFFTLLALPAQAAVLEQEWEPTPGATAYEYEVARGAQFSEKDRVRQGQVQDNHLHLSNLAPGLYHFRLRVLMADGKASAWSEPQRALIKAESPKVLAPTVNAKLEIYAGSQGSLVAEWTSVSGAVDYQATLKGPDNLILSQVTPVGRATFTVAKPGHYEMRVLARIQGEPVSQSEAVKFEIAAKSLPKPRFLEPREGEVLTAYEYTPVRWTRSLPGEHSELQVVRVDPSGSFRLLSQEPITGQTHSYLPQLPAGRYQVVIRDFSEGDLQNSEDRITVQVEENPLSEHSHYSRITWRLASVGALFGWYGQKNDQIKGGTYAKSALGQPAVEFSSRLLGQKLWGNWGAQLAFSSTNSTFMVPGNTFDRSSSIMSLGLGPTYAYEPWGPNKPLLFKALLFYRDSTQILEPSLQLANNERLDRSPLRLSGLELAVEGHWGGWKHRYDVFGELRTQIPLLSESGRFFGRGQPSLLPSFDLMLALRRKISDQVRLFVGGRLLAQQISVSESAPPGSDVTDRPSTLESRLQLGPQLGLEWDL